MAFFRVKIIKLLPYLYKEERFRKGDKVCSKSTYVGALSELAGGGGSFGTLSKNDHKEKIKELQTEIKKRISPISFRAEVREDTIKRRFQVSNILKDALKNHDTLSKIVKFQVPEPNKKTKPTKKNEPKISIDSYIDEKFNLRDNRLSRVALRKELETHLKHISKSGLDIKTFPKILLEKSGKKAGYRKNILSKGYTVYLPSGTPKDMGFFRIGYRKAIAGASLDLLSQQDRKSYNELKKLFQTSFDRTQEKVRHYIKHDEAKRRAESKNRKPKKKSKPKKTKRKTKIKKIKPTSKSNNVKSAMRKGFLVQLVGGKTTARKLGLVDSQPMGDWQEDAISVLAEVIPKGARRAIEERQAECKQAEKDVKKAESQLKHHQGIFKIFDAEWQIANIAHSKSLARFELQKEALNKIRFIKQHFKM